MYSINTLTFLNIFSLNIQVASIYALHFSLKPTTPKVCDKQQSPFLPCAIFHRTKNQPNALCLRFWTWKFPLPWKMIGYFSCRFDKYATPQQFTFSVDFHIHRNIGTSLSALRMKALENRKRREKDVNCERELSA